MPVFYTTSGRAYHYYRDCHQLTKGTPEIRQTATADALDRPPCHTCRARRALTERAADTPGRPLPPSPAAHPSPCLLR